MAASVSVGQAAVINGVDFTTVYTGATLPNAADPAWTATVSSSAVVTANSPSAGILTINTSADSGSNAYYSISNSSIWNGSSNSTIEFSLKIDSLAPVVLSSANVYFGNGSIDYRIFFTPNSVLFGDLAGSRGSATGTYASYSFNTTTFNTYRLVLVGGSMSMYINDSQTAAVSGYTGTAPTSFNGIRFGDGSGITGGVSEWSYLAFTNAGGFAPVPEPATVGLCFAAGMVLILARRKTVLDR